MYRGAPRAAHERNRIRTAVDMRPLYTCATGLFKLISSSMIALPVGSLCFLLRFVIDLCRRLRTLWLISEIIKLWTRTLDGPHYCWVAYTWVRHQYRWLTIPTPIELRVDMMQIVICLILNKEVNSWSLYNALHFDERNFFTCTFFEEYEFVLPNPTRVPQCGVWLHRPT